MKEIERIYAELARVFSNSPPDRRRAYEIVDAFEQALCEYTGAPLCVATDSCTNALFMSLLWWKEEHPFVARSVGLPKHNYVGVVQAIRNAGFEISF